MTALKKPNLEQILKGFKANEEKRNLYASQIEKAQKDLDLLNNMADACENPAYEIAQRSHLAVYIDETKQAYLEITGTPYVPKEKP